MKVNIDYDELEQFAKNLNTLSNEYADIYKRVNAQFTKIFSLWKSENATLLQLKVSDLLKRLNDNEHNMSTFSTLIMLMRDNFNISEREFNELIMNDNTLLEGDVDE